jgi:hypothetical protein
VSILQLRQMFDKKGCQVLLGLVGIALAVGLLSTGTCMAGSGGPQTFDDLTVLTVAGRAVPYRELAKGVEEARRSRPQTDPSTMFFSGIQALDSIITQASLTALAKTKGVTLTDAQAVKLFEDSMAGRLQEAKSQMIQQGILKPDADDAAFNEAFKKSQGVSVAEAVKSAVDDFAAAIKDPDRAFEARSSVLGLALREKYVADAPETLDDVKKSFETFKLVRIAFDDVSKPSEERRAQAEKALEELKGGAKFMDVLAKYTPKGSKEPLDLSRNTMEAEPTFKPLLELKPGQHSEIVDQFGTPVIFYVSAIEPGTPPDFEKNKDAFLKTYKERKANSRLQEDIKALKDPASITWGDPALKLAYEVYSAMSGGTAPGERKDLLKRLAEESQTVEAKTPLGQNLAELAGFAAFENYYMMLNPEEQVAARPERLERLRKALEGTEDINLRLLLYDTLLEEGQFEEAAAELKDAAGMVVGFGPMDVAMLGEVRSRLAAAEKNPKMQKEWLQGTRDELDRWAKERSVYEKEQKELEEERKKAEAELEKAEAEERAKLEAERKAAEQKKKDEPDSGG